jgi:hypothetical protein
LLVELGMEAEAKRELARVAADGLDSFRESLWLASLAYLTDAAAALGDEVVAELVYPELEPHAGANVMIGHLVSCYGAADRYLGMLAAAKRRWDAAEAHYDTALALETGLRSPPLLARTRYWFGRMLLARRHAGDGERAAGLLGAGADTARQLGMAGLTADICAIYARSTAGP